MPDNQQERSASEILADLSLFLSGPEDEETLDGIDSVQEDLRSEGIDTAELKEWAVQRVGALKARVSLQSSKEKRLRMLEMFDQISNRLAGKLLPQKEAILARIQAMSDSDPDAAQIFCRKFEEASEEDLPGLVEDLEMLGDFEESGDSGDDA